ncbi:unnamed protein product [Closterium sp. NIES-53]
MASLRVLAFDHEGRPIQFDTWLDDLQLYLQSDYRDSVLLFDHTSSAAPAPPRTADSATRSQWHTRDAAARLAICNHLPLAECAHFGQHRTAQEGYDAVVARYSSPATAALGRLLLPYLFPELSAFATVEDLVSHLCTSDACYQAAVAAARARVAGVVAVAAGVVVGAAVEVVEAVEVVVGVGVVAGVVALVAAVVAAGGGGGSGGSGSGGGRVGATQRGGSGSGQRRQQQHRSESPSPQQLREWFSQRGASRGSGSCPYVIRTGDRAGQTCGKPHTQHRCFSRLDHAEREEFGDKAERPRWAELLRSGVAIFDLDYDAILAAMYGVSVSAEGDYYRCVPPDPGASRYFYRDSTTLTPLSAPVPVRLADPSGGPVVAHSSTVLPYLAVPSRSLSSLHLPSFSTNFVSIAALQDAMVNTTTWGSASVDLHVYTNGPSPGHVHSSAGSSLYTLATEPPQEAAPAQVSASGPVAPPYLCRLLLHQTLLWHHRLGHPSLPSLRGMHSCLLGRESYFLLVVNDYTRYIMVFPLHSKGKVPDVLIPWIHAVRLQLRERFRQELPVLRLHSDRGSEFSSDLLRAFCRGKGIL